MRRFDRQLFSNVALCGTLVLVIPTREGVVVAADSIASVQGRTLPNREKLHFIANSHNVAFAITGTSEFYPSPPPDADVASWIQQVRPTFSAVARVSDFLTTHPQNPTCEAGLHHLGEVVELAFEQYFLSRPETLAEFAGRDICRPVVVWYDTQTRTATLATLVLRVTNAGIIVCTGFELDRIGCLDTRYIRYFGEVDYVQNNVLRPNAVGWNNLPTDMMDLWNKPKKVSDMSPQNAARIAAGVIRATEITSQTVPIKTAVGGEPRMYLLDGKSEAHRVYP